MTVSRKFAVASIAVLSVFVLSAATARSADKLKIGFMSTFIGPLGQLGQQNFDGFMLGLDHANGRLGGLPTEIIKVDDQLKPEVGVSLAKTLVERDKVDFVVGVLGSNVLIATYQIVADANTFLIGTNAGPGLLAGEKCNPFFFSASWQNDTADEAMGRYLTQQGVKRIMTFAPNYVTGRDAIASFKRTYKGEVVKEFYTGMDQLDYAAELAQLKSSGVDTIYLFYPGGYGINFLKQLTLAGLRSSVKTYSKSTTEWTTLKAQGDAAVGGYEFAHWNSDLDNPANKRFMADFMKKYNYHPSIYAEQGYDAAQLVDSAVRIVKGDLTNKDELRKALMAAKFDSPRGPFRYNRNHFPIHNEYLVQAVKLPDGELAIASTGTVLHDVEDSYAGKCPMK